MASFAAAAAAAAAAAVPSSATTRSRRPLARGRPPGPLRFASKQTASATSYEQNAAGVSWRSQTRVAALGSSSHVVQRAGAAAGSAQTAGEGGNLTNATAVIG